MSDPLLSLPTLAEVFEAVRERKQRERFKSMLEKEQARKAGEQGQGRPADAGPQSKSDILEDDAEAIAGEGGAAIGDVDMEEMMLQAAMRARMKKEEESQLSELADTTAGPPAGGGGAQ